MNSTSPDSTPSGPSQGVRTTVNFLLFVHLFALGVVVLLNGNGTALRQALRKFPGLYLQLLYQDIDFDSGQRYNPRRSEEGQPEFVSISRRGMYHLTQAEFHDSGFFVEVEFEKDGQQQTVRIPDRGTWPHQRFRRDQVLALEVSRRLGGDDARVELPTAVAAGVLRRHGVQLGTVRVWRLRLQETQHALSSDRRERDPWNEMWLGEIDDPDQPLVRRPLLEGIVKLTDDEPLFLPIEEREGLSAPGASEPPPEE